MARYVLIEFDDDAQANRLVEKLVEDEAAGRGRRAVGLFFKPTRFCECELELSRINQRPIKNMVRGKKFGVMVHRDCRRPMPGYQHPDNLLFPKTSGNQYETTWLSTDEGREYLKSMGIVPHYPQVGTNPHFSGREVSTPVTSEGKVEPDPSSPVWAIERRWPVVWPSRIALLEHPTVKAGPAQDRYRHGF